MKITRSLWVFGPLSVWLALLFLVFALHGSSAPIIDGQGIAIVGTGHVDLAGYKVILIYCDHLQDVFPSSSADNTFDIPGGTGFVIQIQNPRGEWAMIGAFGPSADGVATTQTACLSNPFAYNLILSSTGSGSPVTIFWPGAPSQIFTVHRSGQKIWLESGAGSSPQPTPTPTPQPPSGGRDMAGILSQSGEGWALTFSGGSIQIIGRSCNLQIYESSSVGGEERSVTITGCSFRPTLTILRIGGGLWFSRATGCVRLVNSGAQIDISGCGPTVAPPQPPSPPVSGGCISQFDTNPRNGILDDAEFFAFIDAWIDIRIDDTCFFRGVDVWVDQELIAGLGSDPKVLVSRTARGMTFKAQGGMLIGVAVYNLNGWLMFRHDLPGAMLRWDFQGGSGPLANGVYLYVASVQGADGRVVREVKKFVVLR